MSRSPGLGRSPAGTFTDSRVSAALLFHFVRGKKKGIAVCEADRDPETDTWTDKGELRATGGTPATVTLEGSWDRNMMSQTVLPSDPHRYDLED